MPAPTLLPLGLKKDGDRGLIVEWNDGHRSVLGWAHLRSNCPCAGCKEERERPPDPFRVLSPKDLEPRPPLRPTALTPVGLYAYKITWNDGHDTGIFTLDHLRRLCQCQQCQ